MRVRTHDQPAALASKVFEQDSVVEARIDDERRGLLVKTRDADAFYLAAIRGTVSWPLVAAAVAAAVLVAALAAVGLRKLGRA